MRTYILYRNEEEIFIGTIEECIEYMDGEIYSNDPIYHIVIACPNGYDLNSLPEEYRKIIFHRLSFTDRVKMINKLIDGNKTIKEE